MKVNAFNDPGQWPIIRMGLRRGPWHKMPRQFLFLQMLLDLLSICLAVCFASCLCESDYGMETRLTFHSDEFFTAKNTTLRMKHYPKAAFVLPDNSTQSNCTIQKANKAALYPIQHILLKHHIQCPTIYLDLLHKFYHIYKYYNDWTSKGL